MTEHDNGTLFPTDTQETAVRPDEVTNVVAEPEVVHASVNAEDTPTVNDLEETNGVGPRRWQAEAGRKGALRVHELIEAGRRYEQEHGLKSGRQRLRQLIELGKQYEQEHGLRPRLRKHSNRLSRTDREELLGTLLQCMIRIAKPSFRTELVRIAEALREEETGRAA